MFIKAAYRLGKPLVRLRPGVIMMRSFPIPSNEDGRLSAIQATDALGQTPHARLDEITEELAHAFGCPTALVSIVDSDRQYFRSRYGFDACETSRDKSICAHVIMAPRRLVVCDTHADARFRNHPVVIDPPCVRFYVGTPIVLSDNFRAGSLCVLDFVPRDAPSDEALALLSRRAQEVGQIIMASKPEDAIHSERKPGFSDTFLEIAGGADDVPATLEFRRHQNNDAPPTDIKTDHSDQSRAISGFDASRPADSNQANKPDAAASPPALPQETAPVANPPVNPAELARREFLCLVGHELRTPLTVLMGYAKILENRADDSPNKLLISAISRMGDHLHAVVESVLKYSDLASGERMLNEDTHATLGILEESAALVRPSAELAGKSLAEDFAGIPDHVTVDREQIKLVLVSLLKNAVTHGGTSLTFSARPTAEGHLDIEIADDGDQIPDERLSIIFKPFQNGGLIKNHGEKGIGLGLALTKRIVEMHGGEINLTRKDHANRFNVLLPNWRV